MTFYRMDGRRWMTTATRIRKTLKMNRDRASVLSTDMTFAHPFKQLALGSAITLLKLVHDFSHHLA